MRRIVTWLLSTLSVLVLLFGYHTSTGGTVAATAPTITVPGGKSSTTISGGTGGTGGTGGGASGSGTGAGQGTAARTTTVTGAAVNTRWGPVQVQLTVTGGQITDVAMLQYPDANGTDQQISSYALPILMQSTVDAQSADIDMVSGATYTSTGYLQSLQSALDQVGIR